MPDLKTELTTKVLPVINNIDDLSFDDTAPTQEPMVKRIFECVKQFGPCTADSVAAKLGIERGGVHARLQSLRQRHFVQRSKNQPGPYLYVAVEKDYVVMSPAERVAKMNAQRKALKAAGLTPPRKKKSTPEPRTPERRHEAAPITKTNAPTPPAPAPADDMETFINSLTVADAIKLRNKLNEVFGLS